MILATARFETCTRLANFSSNSSLSHVESCIRNDVAASLSSMKTINQVNMKKLRFIGAKIGTILHGSEKAMLSQFLYIYNKMLPHWNRNFKSIKYVFFGSMKPKWARLENKR